MTKIDIISGFLGAGKTTLIKKLIEEAFTGEKLVLIENEFGEIGIDGGFLKDSGINITEMNSGCICCSLVGDFGTALAEVLEKYAPDRIIIEPSGVGKLSDVIKAVLGVKEKVAEDSVVLNSFTTVADATKCKMYMKNFGEFFNDQVEHASAIILSRTQKLDPAKLNGAVHLLREKNSQAAILTTFNECDMSAVMELRRQFNASFRERYGTKLGFMGFFIKAAVKALKEVPQVNAKIDGTDIVENLYYDISVAIGTDKGLVVPVLRDCDRKTLPELELELAALAEKARKGALSMQDLQGGCFTISNGGTYGSLLSTPILNPPQSGILGMHAIQERPVVRDGQITIRPMMYLALSYDHRLVDGKQAVQFLIAVKNAVENPVFEL